ncbi:hypothetical protein A9Q99_15940 [Gammaproteobacteria bacterium 45_16_T64]|nr:hypothetical protein A9Q99_15940 [Gammaproteobacteria bacterium 45_16_T64]
MTIKRKLLLFSISLAIAPALVVAGIVGWSSYSEGRNAIEAQAKAQLISIRDIKKQQIESYFEQIEKQVLTFSNDRMIIEAMSEFNSAFSNTKQQTSLNDTAALTSALTTYYTNEFAVEYQKRNNGETPNIQKLLANLDNDSLALQYQYISNNTHPLGAKDSLINPNDGSDYGSVHTKYHPHIRDFLTKFEYYDIFLADPKTGDIVYSVFKELDYSTSLISGPYANTGIGQAFALANDANDQSFVGLTDFAPYLPSYQDPAAFIASPIWDEGKKVGILIFQMPIDRINHIMTHGQRWTDSGLGESGETYLVGPDLTMRSMSRFLLEDPDAYLALLEKTDSITNTTVDTIRSKNTSIGLQPVESLGAKAAMNGETEFNIFPDYRGVSVLSAYSPLAIRGLHWAIMSEIDEAEAFRSSFELRRGIIVISGIAVTITALLALIAANLFASQLTRPLENFAKTIAEINQHSDLSRRVPVSGDDEISRSAQTINSLLEAFQDTVRFLIDTIQRLKTSSTNLANQTQQLEQVSGRQQQQSAQVATASSQLASAANEIASNAEHTAQSTLDANDTGKNGNVLVKECIENTQALATNVSNTRSTLDNVAQESNNIGSVLQVIQDIAEQTNLLALNAAIEAARAGEQGRGFAVVADEVRNLAQRTRESTEEINQTITKLQHGVDASVSAIQGSMEQTEHNVIQINALGESLISVTTHLQSISDMNEQIATAATEQLATSDNISSAIRDVNEASQETAATSQQTSIAGADIEKLATQLQDFVSRYSI